MLTTAPAKIECARVALDWLDAAEDARFPQGLRDILVKAVAELDDVRSAVANYANANTQLRARLQCLSQQYGVQDLSCEDGRKLIAQLDSLLAAGTQLKEVLELRDQRRRLDAAAVDHVLRRAEDVGVAPQAWCALLAALIATGQAQNAVGPTPVWWTVEVLGSGYSV